MNFMKKLLVRENIILKITEYHVRLEFSAEMSKRICENKIVNSDHIRDSCCENNSCYGN